MWADYKQPAFRLVSQGDPSAQPSSNFCKVVPAPTSPCQLRTIIKSSKIPSPYRLPPIPPRKFQHTRIRTETPKIKKKWKVDPTDSRSLKKRKRGEINSQTTNQSIFTRFKVPNEQNYQPQRIHQQIKNPAKRESIGNTPNSLSIIRTAISEARRNFMLEHRRQTLTILKYIDDDIIIWSSRGDDLPFSDLKRSTREET